MGEPLRVELPVQIPDALEFLFHPPLGSVRYRVAYGGRGGTKSWNFARALLTHGVERKHRFLCVREYQSSIRESVHYTLTQQAELLGLGEFYGPPQRTRIEGRNGTEFLFYGLKRDPHTIKSLEGITVCWVEEAHALSQESLDVLLPTIREEGSEIWFSFNPGLSDDPFYRLFCGERPPENSIIRKVGWQDNPWLSDTLRAQREDALRRDPEAEAHIWGGIPWERSDSQVLGGAYRIAEFKPEDHWGGPYFGADWGFSQDPTTLVRLWIADSRLYIDREVRGVGWSVAETDKRFRTIPGADEHVIRADAARPETIAALRQNKHDAEGEIIERGLNVVAAKKWPGSVEDGIDHLRGYEEIVIHPECPGIIQDARLWRYKTDPRTGDVLPKLVDGNEHAWDAARYALAPLIRKRPRFEVLT
jgi:phage terminase large subunit